MEGILTSLRAIGHRWRFTGNKPMSNQHKEEDGEQNRLRRLTDPNATTMPVVSDSTGLLQPPHCVALAAPLEVVWDALCSIFPLPRNSASTDSGEFRPAIVRNPAATWGVWVVRGKWEGRSLGALGLYN
jgi:hypothetical protein